MLKRVNLKKLRKDKKAISEMIAYVILISIALGLAAAVYAWLRYFPPIINEPVGCKEGTTISLENYSCTSDGNIILTIKNTGRFNIDGIIAKFGNDSDKEPVTMLKPNYTVVLPAAPTPGHFSFNLTTGKSKEAKFNSIKSDNTPYNPSGGIVRVAQIQPFIMDKRKKITCIGAVIKEPLINPECKITT